MGGIAHLVLSGPLVLAVPVAAAAGAASFLSPCCLPLVPGYVSYVTGMSGADLQRAAGTASRGSGGRPGALAVAAAPAGYADGTGSRLRLARRGRTAGVVGRGGTPAVAGRGRTLAGAALFVLGFAALFATYGALFGGLGGTLAAHQRGLAQILGALTIVLGLLFMGVFERFSLAGLTMRPSFRPRAGLLGAPILGVMFGLGWTPCIGPTLAVVMSMSVSTGTAARGAFLAFVYALGLGVPFLVAAFALQRGMRAFGFARRHARLIMQVGGVMLIVVGTLQVSGVWATAVGSLQHWISGYTAPL